MHYIYGPIPSRRLGQSLGVDPIPLKTCNWNCIYCQLGRSVPLISQRREYVPRAAVMAELTSALAAHAPGEIDYISFVGSGEPTLHSGLGWLIRQTKAITGIPVAVITNGATLYLPEVRADVRAADVIMPTLSAGSAGLHLAIHRHHPDLDFDRHVEGIIGLRAEYSGLLWIEVMLIHGMNDSQQALTDLAAVIARVQPDEVHITLPTRPPSETWVEPPDHEGLMRATAVLGDIARVVHPGDNGFDLSGGADGGCHDIMQAIIDIITRHPMSQAQLECALQRWAPTQVQSTLAELAASGAAQRVERLGVIFWSASPSHFPDRTASQATSPQRLRTRG